ncbi:little elongation complex subunit 2 [Pelodytes ibericus]
MEGAGELKWDIEPKNGKNCFFTHTAYEKYSLGPTLAELLLLATKPQKPTVADPPTEEKASISQSSILETPEVTSTVEGPALPEPRVPYPHFSSLTMLEQRTYVQLMIRYLGKKGYKPVGMQLKEYDQYMFLKMKSSSENAEFQKFLQNSARRCAEDYNCLSVDAQLYTQEVLKASLAYVKNYPELYILHEVTSILGGKIIPDLALKLEKCLLKMGPVPFVRIKFPTTELDLNTTFKNVSAAVPPATKAALMHTSVISDPNATKLAAKYCPQVVMTSQVLYTLLNNHGANYKEQWEIPIRVETINTAGGKTSKIVYMDSPLPKKEMSIREKSQMFHEVPLDKFMLKKSSIFLKVLDLDRGGQGCYVSTLCNESQMFSRIQESCDSMAVDFENDVTELETFGTVNKRTDKPRPIESESESSAPKSTSSNMEKSLMDKLMMEKQILKSTSPVNIDDKAIPDVKANFSGQTLWSDSDDASSFKGFESDELKDCIASNGESSDEGKPLKSSSKSKPCAEKQTHSDSEDERLVIDIDCKKMEKCKKMDAPSSDCRDSTSSLAPVIQDSQTLPRKSARRISKEFDPVGQIMKMQTRMLKPGAKNMQEQSAVKQETIGQLPSNTPVLEPVGDTPAKRASRQLLDLKKPLLPTDLLTSIEDESEYTTVPEGNCIYKLFSLDDMVLLIRSRVHKAFTRVRAHQKNTRKHLPVYVLAKMDYQMCYGAEVLTDSEICRLWTERLLHSNSLFYIGHIDALTSKFFMLEEVTSDELKDRLNNFNPANSLVILRHILKKIINLQDGSYLLSHISGDSSVSIYKSITKKMRGTYNLHEAHSRLPKASSSLSVPWVPLDPNLLLPYHVHHGWPPCTFPPQPQGVTGNIKENKQRQSTVGEKRPSATQPVRKQPPQKKKNKGKRPNRLKRWRTKQKEWKDKAALQKQASDPRGCDQLSTSVAPPQSVDDRPVTAFNAAGYRTIAGTKHYVVHVAQQLTIMVSRREWFHAQMMETQE